MLRILLVVCFFVFAAPLFAQEKGKEKRLPGDDMIEKYLAAETDKLSKRFLDGAATLKEWQEKRPRLQREYLDMLGLWPLPEKTPLKATITGTFEHQGVIVENLHFQSMPGLYVTANFYRPKSPPAKKLPTILYVCGHSNKGRDGSKSAYQDHPMWFASNGYNCLILDTLQLAEIPGVHHGTYGRPWNHLKAYGIKDKDGVENRWWWHSAGYCPSGVEAWNGIRAIDYLLTREEVDPEKIGVTGISGGGAATFWIACADERVKVAVPVSGMSDLESYVKNKVINGHCDCMFLYNTYQWDWTTIAALVAPRPMLFANSDNDTIFPMDGNRRIMTKLQKLYDMYGKGDLVEEYVSKGGHAYRPDLRIAIFKFINKHLKRDEKSEVKDAEFEKIDGKRLRVFPTDADLPKDSINHRVDEVFVKRGKVELPEKGKYEEWRKRLVAEVAKIVLRSVDRPITAARVMKGPSKRGPMFLLETQPGIQLEVAAIPAKVDAFTIAVLNSEDARDEKAFVASIEQLLEGESGLLVLPRGFDGKGLGGVEWTRKSPPNYVERSHALLGDTADEKRVYDVASILAWVDAQKHEKGEKPRLFGDDLKIRVRVGGQKQAGILAAYAALFEPYIQEVVVINPPKSHMEGPHFLGILRVLDIPDALGLLAPRKLTIVGGRDAAFDRTEEIYRRAGAADKLIRK
jgi:cephalosporin-C deacetylase-like acetyl esterase